MLTFLKGKKTYAVAFAGAAIIILNALGVPLPGVTLDPTNWLPDLLTAAAAATMRGAVAKKH